MQQAQQEHAVDILTHLVLLAQASDSIFAGDVLIGVDDHVVEAGQATAYSSLIVRVHSFGCCLTVDAFFHKYFMFTMSWVKRCRPL